jgi:hypothetical protein
MRHTILFFAVATLLIATAQPTEAGHSVNLLESGVVTLKTTECWDHMFESIVAVSEEGKTIISGDISKHHSQSAGRDEIKISIVSPEGDMIAEKTVAYAPKIGAISTQRGESSFLATFDLTPSAGSVIHLYCMAQHEHNE